MKKRPALLDVNVLIALFDERHVHHDAAHDWFADHRRQGWATCPLTENGFLRVLTHPRIGATDHDLVLSSLQTFCEMGEHVFWADTVSLRDQDLFDHSRILSHRQLTDIYLLGLATRMGGRLATFDAKIPLSSVKGASRDSLMVIAAAG